MEYPIGKTKDANRIAYTHNYILEWGEGCMGGHPYLMVDGLKKYFFPISSDWHLTNKKAPNSKRAKCLILLARPAGFEPATYGFVVRHSIR